MKILFSVRVIGEVSLLVVEWLYDVCRFLLKWFKLNLFKFFKEVVKDIYVIDKSIGMLVIEKLILYVFYCVGFCIDLCLCF